MEKSLRAKAIVNRIKDQTKKKVEELNVKGIYPALGIVRLGKNPDDIAYEKSIIKACTSMGIRTSIIEKDQSIRTDQLAEEIIRLNEDHAISGILVFRPLPKHIDEEAIRNTIDPKKDVDCMHPLNLVKIFEGDMSGFVPCTPKAAMEVLLHNNIELEGKNVAIINRSTVVGKPLAMMLLEKNATVTICHSRTRDLDQVTRRADIVVTALGKAKFFDRKYFNKESILTDVGISLDDKGKISGDIDYENVFDSVKAITPVPGGVGSITTSILLQYVVKACE